MRSKEGVNPNNAVKSVKKTKPTTNINRPENIPVKI